MKRFITSFIVLSLIAGGVFAQDYSGDSYRGNQAQRAQQVTTAQILGIRQVTIKGDPNVIVGTAGAGLGALAVLGLAGTNGNPYGLAAGTIVAALVGGGYTNEIAKKMVEQPGFEFTLKLNDGRIITVAQSNIDAMGLGDTVYITQSTDGTLRVYKL